MSANGHDEQRRGELGAFLRNRRARLAPTDVGLAAGQRRRTPGLRREEVAQLAGVSPTWYTWLEQARNVRPSAQVADSLAQALRLDSAERAHLFQLARGEIVAPERSVEDVSPAVRRLVAHLGPNPAWITGRRGDLLAWNRAAMAVFGDYSGLAEGRRNLVWLVFTDPHLRTLLIDWEQSARHLLAQLRAASARAPGDPSFRALIDELRQVSPEFRRWWQRHDVTGLAEGRKELDHPTMGRMVFEHADFQAAEAPELRLVLYSPHPEADTPAKLKRLMESIAEPSPHS